MARRFMWVPFLVASLAVAGCFGSGPGGGSGDAPAFLTEDQAEDIQYLLSLYQRNGFEAREEVAGDKSFLVVKHPEANGKVLVKPVPDRKCYQMALIYRKKEGIPLSYDMFEKVNNLNRDGFLKLYLDSDGDIWFEHYVSYRGGIMQENLLGFTQYFAHLGSLSAARYFGDYLN